MGMAAADQHQISHHRPVYPTMSGTGTVMKNVVYQSFISISYSYFGANDGRYVRPLHFPGAARPPSRRLALGVGGVLAPAAGPCRLRVPEQPDRPAAAERPRHALAHHRRQLDPDARQRAHDRQLLLHLPRPALDRQGMAVAGPAGAGVQHRRLGRRDGIGRRRDRPHLRAAAALADARYPAVAGAAVHGGRPCDDGAAPARPSAHAGVPAHPPVGRGPGARRRAARRARLPAAAGHAAVGQHAWRLHARPGAGGSLRARCRGGRARCRRAACAVHRLGQVRRGGAAGRLHHALWAGIDPGDLAHLRLRRGAARHRRMARAGFPEAAGAGAGAAGGASISPCRAG